MPRGKRAGLKYKERMQMKADQAAAAEDLAAQTEDGTVPMDFKQEEKSDTPTSTPLPLMDLDINKRWRLSEVPPFTLQGMRAKWKWSVRLYSVTPEDALMSGLMNMNRVQDSCYYLPAKNQNKGILELCCRGTGDMLLTMLRILRYEFVQGFIIIEVNKRQAVKNRRPALPGFPVASGTPVANDDTTPESAAQMESNASTCEVETVVKEEVQEEVGAADAAAANVEESEEADKAQEEPLAEDTGEDQKDGDKEAAGESIPVLENKPDVQLTKKAPLQRFLGKRTPMLWTEVREAATYTVNMRRVQNIKYTPVVKGCMSDRSVYVGIVPKCTTEEILKVMFPMANSVLLKGTGDPNTRHAFIETCTHYNAVGFALAYNSVTINNQSIKLSATDPSLLLLKDEQELKIKKAEEGETKEKEAEVSQVAEGVVEIKEEVCLKAEKEEQVQEVGGEGDKAEEDVALKAEKVDQDEGDLKPEDKGETAEETSGTPVLDQEQKKRKQETNRFKKKRKRQIFEEIQKEWSMPKRPREAGNSPRPGPFSGPLLGPGPMGRGRGVPFRGFGGPAFMPGPPLIQLQDKITDLMRLHNQLEMTIQTQMSLLQHADIAAKQKAELNSFSMEFASRTPPGGFRGAVGGGRFADLPTGRGDGGFRKGGGTKNQNQFGRTPSFKGMGSQPSIGSGKKDFGFGNKKFRRDSDAGSEQQQEASPFGRKDSSGGGGGGNQGGFSGNKGTSGGGSAFGNIKGTTGGGPAFGAKAFGNNKGKGKGNRFDRNNKNFNFSGNSGNFSGKMGASSGGSWKSGNTGTGSSGFSGSSFGARGNNSYNFGRGSSNFASGTSGNSSYTGSSGFGSGSNQFTSGTGAAGGNFSSAGTLGTSSNFGTGGGNFGTGGNYGTGGNFGSGSSFGTGSYSSGMGSFGNSATSWGTPATTSSYSMGTSGTTYGNSFANTGTSSFGNTGSSAYGNTGNSSYGNTGNSSYGNTSSTSWPDTSYSTNSYKRY